MTNPFSYNNGVLTGLDGVTCNLYDPSCPPANKHVLDAMGFNQSDAMNDAHNQDPETFCAVADMVAEQVIPDIQRGHIPEPLVEMLVRDYRDAEAASVGIPRAH